MINPIIFTRTRVAVGAAAAWARRHEGLGALVHNHTLELELLRKDLRSLSAKAGQSNQSNLDGQNGVAGARGAWAARQLQLGRQRQGEGDQPAGGGEEVSVQARATARTGEKALGEKALGEKALGEKALGEKALGQVREPPGFTRRPSTASAHVTVESARCPHAGDAGRARVGGGEGGGGSGGRCEARWRTAA
jgi:hypothetical protein